MSSSQKVVNKTIISLVQGDITRQEVDAIVNAANSSLLGGGGVDGAIHRAGGPSILEECKQIRNTHGTCRPGSAVITGGGNLPARYVIHTVGPIWRGGNSDEDTVLSSAYQSSLDLAVQYEVKTVAFPSISTGAYGFPVDRAAAIAVETARSFSEKCEALKEIRFVLFDQSTYKCFKSRIEE
ncbi:MAG: O-acetyl-ADP-ribose deacetylase [Cyanobacteria bacterium]|nr:O-acetyl-ADP-ribose deacetylase [Cyanobacteriota bacterium]